MRIIVIPPEIEDPSVLDIPEAAEGDAIFLVDGSAQERILGVLLAEGKRQIHPADFMADGAFKDADRHIRNYGRNWYRQKEIAELLTFRGVNIAGQLMIAFTFYFTKVLKAVVVSRELLKAYRDREFVLLDDQSVWAKVFKHVARELGTPVKAVIAPKVLSSLASEVKAACSETGPLKKIAMKLFKPDMKKIPPGGILYSCAFRFAEPLWKSVDSRVPVYYLRPGFSFKQLGSVSKNGAPVNNLAAEYFMDNSSEKICRQWVSGRDIAGVFESCFEQNRFFDLEGINIAYLVKNDLAGMLDMCLLDGARRIISFERMFDLIKPVLIIVEEDTCPFNKLLVECAHRKNIRSIQLLHGLLASDFLLDGVNSGRIAVPGEYARNRLVRWGIDEKKVLMLGAPHYENKTGLIQAGNSRSKLISTYNLSKDVRLVTLFMPPVYTEQNPYFIDNPLTRENAKKIIAIACRSVRRIKNANLIIKKHPMDNKEGFIEKEAGLALDPGMFLVVKEYDSMELVASSDIVLCSGSTVYLEALLLKTPVVIFEDFNKRFWEEVKGDVIDLNSHDESVEKIRRIVEDGLVRGARLAGQEEELSLHFVNKNLGSIERFSGLVRESIE